MTDDLYYRKLENTSTTDLVDMIREKDKSIAELEEKLEQTEKDLADYQFNYPTIKELEKENAELKADNEARKFAMAMSEKVEKQLRNERNTFLAQNEQYEKDLINFNNNLTKAKTVLRNVIDYLGQFCSDYPDCVIEAEQFLREVKK